MAKAKKKGTDTVTTRTVTALLSTVCAATLAGTTAWIDKAQATTDGLFTDPALVEINEAMVNPANAGEFAGRATQAGLDLYAAAKNGGNAAPVDPAANTAGAAARATPAAAQPAQIFTLDTAIPIPAAKRIRRSGDSKYPFADMAVGQSFFVAGTTEHPDPAKGLTATVHNATMKYATPKLAADGTTPVMREGFKRVKGADGKVTRVAAQVPDFNYTRKFIVRPVTENGTKGARVWRES